MMSEKYNGWTNYETWNVALWINNDQGSQEAVQELAEAAWSDNDGDKEAATEALAAEIEGMHDAELNELNTYGTFADILNAGMRVVDWYEIAATFIEEVADES